MQHRIVVVFLVSALVAGCAAATPLVSPSGTPFPPPAATSDAATEPPADPPVTSPTPEPTARPAPSPTPVPVPPKPSGVTLRERDTGTCPEDDPMSTCSIDDAWITVRWQQPRTKGVVIRVYGVTKCLWADSLGEPIDGRCLRPRTELPARMRILLATVPAAKGKVTIHMTPGTVVAATLDGREIYSIVLAAYNRDGEHSVFTIAEAGDACLFTDRACDD
jgi:hypothetical protein